MFKSKFSMVGIIIIIFAVFMQYRGGVGDISSVFGPGAPAVKTESPAIPPVAAGYVKSSGSAAVGQPALRPFENAEQEKLAVAIAGAGDALSRMGRVPSIKDYNDDCVNIFATKITSSREKGMAAEDISRQSEFKVILNSSDIEYAGYFNTPRGMAAIIKVKKSGAGVLSVGDTLANTNLRLKSMNERYAVFENMMSRAEERVNITSR